MVALDAFLKSDQSENARGELFAAITARFAADRPAQAQLRTMFNAILEYILSPLHHSIFWGDRMLTIDKAAGFFEEEAFSRSYQTIRGSHIYDSYDPPHTIAWRLHTLVWAARSAIAHEGDLVECGVFKGDMSWVVATIWRQDRRPDLLSLRQLRGVFADTVERGGLSGRSRLPEDGR